MIKLSAGKGSLLMVLAFVSATCGGGKDVPNLTGSWTGTCTIGTKTAIMLDITVDAVGHISGTVVNLIEGGTASLNGSVLGDTLNASYSYPQGTTGSVNGTLVPASSDQMTSNMTINEAGAEFPASCAFKRGSAGSSPVSPGDVDAFCTMYGQCAGVSMTMTELQMCRQMALPILQLMPDPEYSKACFARLTCAQLLDDVQLQAAVAACLNVDSSTVVCSGSTLHGCSKTGKCTDVDCSAACTAVGYSFVGCVDDSSAGHQKCGCASGGAPAIPATPAPSPFPDSSGPLPIPDAGAPRPIPDAAPPAPCAQMGLVKTTNAFDLALRGKTLFVADGTGGLKIVDVTSSLSAGVIGTFPSQGDLVAVTTDDRYVYALDATAGLLIIDAANPAAPTLVGSLRLADASSNIPMPPASAGQGGIAVAGSRVYAGGTWGTGLCTIDVSAPATPALVGSCSSESRLTRAGNFRVRDSFLYATALIEFLTVNVANPSGPLVIGSFEPSQTVVSGSPAFLGSVVVLPGASGTSIVSLASPTSPTMVSLLDQSANAAAAAGDYALLASYDGLRFVDLSNVTQPRLLAGCSSSSSSSSGSKLLVQGNQAFLASGSGGVSIWDLYPERLPK